MPVLITKRILGVVVPDARKRELEREHEREESERQHDKNKCTTNSKKPLRNKLHDNTGRTLHEYEVGKHNDNTAEKSKKLGEINLPQGIM